MIETILQFEDASGGILKTCTLPAPISFTIGEIITLSTIIQPGAKALWTPEAS